MLRGEERKQLIRLSLFLGAVVIALAAAVSHIHQRMTPQGSFDWSLSKPEPFNKSGIIYHQKG